MQLETFLAYVIACLILTATLGPSIFLGVVHSLNYGVKRTVFTALGDISANFIQMILVSIGLGVVITNSAVAFDAIKWIGAATLFYMGIKMLLSSSKKLQQGNKVKTLSNRKLYTSGFMVAAGNPKAIVFFTAFFPQFIDTTQPVFPQLAIMCPTMALLDFTLVMLYAFSANKVLQTSGNKLNIINRVSGGVLVAASGALALTER
ncbi:LysE family translocator [Psychromonas algicola]|uniref:LysE family translocator n=1 Tax=Psychromonas algicola TaxID=2555642 RepID=UPI0010682FA4|nr:LysE family translocator [Psychromonas sp. RZ5]TEW52975.1 LysE family translocator [Psychromonas sp. RZ5]